MSGQDRQLYLSATVIDQQFLDYTCQDNLDTKIELIVDIESSTGIIRASDGNKYVGPRFYEALLKFPIISRKITHWLSGTIEFSSLTLELSNVDGRYNMYLPGGSIYTGFVGKTIDVKVGLRDVESTYMSIFQGKITEVGGAARTVKSIIFTARDKMERVNINFPSTALSKTVFPDLETDKIGAVVPVLYGDWTTELNNNQSTVPTLVLNGVAAAADPLNNVKFLISENANEFFENTTVTLYRGTDYTVFDAADIQNISVDNRSFEIVQNGYTMVVKDGVVTSDPWVYDSSDQILVRVKGPNLGGGQDNIIAQAMDIMQNYAGVDPSEFDASWASYQSKSSPPQSAIFSFKSRVWVNEPQEVMSYVVSMLAQVRLEIFISRDFKFKLSSLHFEDWNGVPDYEIKNWDVVQGTFKPSIDERNNFNKAQATYALDPLSNKEIKQTSFFKNEDAIYQVGKEVSKRIIFPNLYLEDDVKLNLIEMIRLSSAYPEMIDLEVTSRSLLRDLGDFVRISVQIGSSVFQGTPAMIRELGYDPQGLKLPMKLWSFQMVPIPGYDPGYSGVVGGYNATIVEET